MPYARPMRITRLCLVIAFSLVACFAHAQHRRHHHAPAQLKPKAPANPPEPKPDQLTLRYKPQAGSLLYDVHTEIHQRIRTDRDELSGSLSSTAQLSFHNVAIDYKKGLWSFDQYFTKFQIGGRQLSGDTLALVETHAVNRITRVTYDMQGLELKKEIIDSIKLLNAEAQTNAYFFQPPRMLIPLPDHGVTYGDTWTDHRCDTINVRDTINIGITAGQYVYDVYRTYRFDKLIDTVGPTSIWDSTGRRYFALIVAVDSGTFAGSQTNSVTNVTTKSSGPLSGSDTTVLDLFSGRVVLRTLRLAIPATVEITSAKPFSDFLEVRSVIVLNESNATRLKQ